MNTTILEKTDNNIEEIANSTLEEEMEKTKKKIRKVRILSAIVVIIVILISYIVWVMGKIGFIAWEGDSIELTEADLKIMRDTELDIFNNVKLNKKNLIAPSSKGEYRFNVKNHSNYNIIYNIRFSDMMTNYINMKYRLKLDNVYIKGNKNEYVDISQLDLESVIIAKNSTNVYTLEWIWEDNDETDTKIGSMKQDQYYMFRIQILADIYDKRS